MRKIVFILGIVIIVFASCNRTHNYIIPVDYEKYYEGVTSLTEKEDQELSQRIYMDWYHNTVGKEIPDIQVKDLDGNTIKLKKWFKRETILIFADPHCGFGEEEVEKEFPIALRNMKDELKDIDILCLVEVEDSNEQETMNYAKSLQGEYNNLFIIDQTDALRTNLTGSPTKFFIDKDQVVRHVHIGFALNQERREEEIRQGISTIRNKEQQ